MTKGLKDGEPNGRDVYPDIIDHPHWQSPTRPHMSLYDRAAQFSPFDALAGYSDMISDEQRLTDQKIELCESDIEKLNQKLNLINDAIRKGENPVVSITCFVPDEMKAGGIYQIITETIKKIDVLRGTIVLTRTEGPGNLNVKINIRDVLDIQGELVDYLDE